ncbi:L,D-transpeptidase [Paenibacillus sp. 1P03SA]|uniref:L,D-transpeptidase n=1 Tax=Paenibacillus sp. 1P03SA TaxID=3132294 RepID=UPI0039A27500
MAYRIDINTSTFVLTLSDDGKTVKTYPVGVGKVGTSTPEGTFTIVNKEPNPGGPFGAFWMGLSKKHYGIHGTNDPSSIGKRSSHGCIRMHNKDVLALSRLVPIGTVVRIHP